MIALGDEVKCKVTGLQGICTSRSDHLYGCTRIGIQPPLDKDGKMREAYWVDEPQCILVKKGKVKVDQPGTPARKAATGGPMTKVIRREVPRATIR